jgi:hypothetical protein
VCVMLQLAAYPGMVHTVEQSSATCYAACMMVFCKGKACTLLYNQ